MRKTRRLVISRSQLFWCCCCFFAIVLKRQWKSRHDTKEQFPQYRDRARSLCSLATLWKSAAVVWRVGDTLDTRRRARTHTFHSRLNPDVYELIRRHRDESDPFLPFCGGDLDFATQKICALKSEKNPQNKTFFSNSRFSSPHHSSSSARFYAVNVFQLAEPNSEFLLVLCFSPLVDWLNMSRISPRALSFIAYVSDETEKEFKATFFFSEE